MAWVVLLSLSFSLLLSSCNLPIFVLFLIFMSLFLWLCQVLVAARSIFHCGAQCPPGHHPTPCDSRSSTKTWFGAGSGSRNYWSQISLHYLPIGFCVQLCPLTCIEWFLRPSEILVHPGLCTGISQKENSETHLGIKRKDDCFTYATSRSSGNMQSTHWQRGMVSTCVVSVSPKERAGVVSVRTAFSHGNRDPNTVTYTKLGIHFLT